MKQISLSIFLITTVMLSTLLWAATPAPSNSAAPKPEHTSLQQATFAGGCFWCMEAPFEKLPGVTNVISGYTGGTIENPSYAQVSAGRTKHLEAIQLQFDPKQISYQQLLEVFWRQIDPTDASGSFVDRGPQYRSAIFYHNPTQQQLAQADQRYLNASGRYPKPIVTEILPASAFYAAEEYHQDYYKKNPIRYHYYRYRSGRDQYLKTIWGSETSSGKPAREVQPASSAVVPSKRQSATRQQLRSTLTPLQFEVTQQDGTERPFENSYWDNHAAGIYVDIVSGEPLFSSTDKFASGTGWPSFTQPIQTDALAQKKDHKFWLVRMEVRSKLADSHLGHVFDDGPAPTGKRYCINSAAMRFIPVDKLQAEGYAEFLTLFKDATQSTAKPAPTH